MYGLVNKAVEGLIINSYGEDNWKKIKVEAKIQTENFISMKNYSDEITYDLITSAEKVLNIPADDLLKALGEYWVLYVAKEGYGEIISLSVKNFIGFVQDLDMLHTRVGLIMPELNPPSFSCTEITNNSLCLHYHSKRRGLAPMVIGLIIGLGKMFELEIVEIKQKSYKSKGDTHDEFFIRW